MPSDNARVERTPRRRPWTVPPPNLPRNPPSVAANTGPRILRFAA